MGSSVVSGASARDRSQDQVKPLQLAPLATPEKIGKYLVLARIGSGAFGVVYRCHDPALDRTVAVKVLLSAGHASADILERFQREARAAARLSHPHIVPVFDLGVDDGNPFLVMEHVEGQTLDCLIGSPRLTVETTLRVIFHLAQALQVAHDQGVIHRDVKPGNVLIDRTGRPRLTDFGLARLAADATRLSKTGDLVGTPRYMSPEQVLLTADEIDHRTDVYSLGVLMYEMLTGCAAADGATPLAVLRHVADEEPVPVLERNPAVPEEVAAICARMMAKDRDVRYQTAGEVANDIQAYILQKMFGSPEVELLAGLPAATVTRRRSRLFWAWGILAAVVLLVTGFVIARFGFPVRLETDTQTSQAQPPAAVSPVADVATVVARTRTELARLPGLTDDRAYRERVTEILDDLNAVLKQQPEVSALALRGRILRRSGDFAAAIADFDKATQGETDNLLLLERVLARYQFEVLYLGSLGEPALRPHPSAELGTDLGKLASSELPAHKAAGKLVSAIISTDSETLTHAVAERPSKVPDELRADFLMLEADALARAAQSAHDEVQAAEDEQKTALRKRRDSLDARCVQAIRRGLEVDSRHLGLLFLKANGWYRRVEWEAADGEDRDQALRRHRPGFDAAYLRFRTVSPRFGLESATGRGVLLSNIGRNELALDQLTEAAGRTALPSSVMALRAWFQLNSPPDGELSAAYAGQILQQLAPSFESPPDEFGLYFTRAIAFAASGKWDDARHDLLDGKRRYRGASWPPQGGYSTWCQSATGPTTKFLDTTVELLGWFPTPAELRIRLEEELIKRLTGPDASLRDGVEADEVRSLTAWGHHRLAKYWAEKDDRANVLKHIRLALEFRLDDLTTQNFKDEPGIKAWNNEDEFAKLYAEFEKKKEGNQDGKAPKDVPNGKP
jgi:tetratricopeptide (TPR) repeat protein